MKPTEGWPAPESGTGNGATLPTATWRGSLLSSLAMPDGIIRELAYEQRRNLVTAINCRLETVFVSRPRAAMPWDARSPAPAAWNGTRPQRQLQLQRQKRTHHCWPALLDAANGSTSTGIEESGEAPLCRRTTPRATRPSSRRQRACGPWSTTRPTAR